MDFLEIPYPVHICDLTWSLIRKGAFRIDKAANDSLKVTYHDPCNVARATGYFEPPRNILKAVCNNFQEMDPHTTRENTYCCGGGGGRIWMETPRNERFGDLRLAQADEVKAQVLATSCPYCVAMFEDSRLARADEDSLAVKDVTEILAEAVEG